MMYWIYDYPSWVIGLLFCGTFVAFTWMGIFLTRATVHSWLHQEKRANEMVGLALSSYFVLFGLLLGLLAVATYQNFANVSDIVDNEASSLAAATQGHRAEGRSRALRLADQKFVGLRAQQRKRKHHL